MLTLRLKKLERRNISEDVCKDAEEVQTLLTALLKVEELLVLKS
jgi:hypothetical protein